MEHGKVKKSGVKKVGTNESRPTREVINKIVVVLNGRV